MAGSKKKFNFWKWVVDSGVDLRYKGPSTGDVGFNALLAQLGGILPRLQLHEVQPDELPRSGGWNCGSGGHGQHRRHRRDRAPAANRRHRWGPAPNSPAGGHGYNSRHRGSPRHSCNREHPSRSAVEEWRGSLQIHTLCLYMVKTPSYLIDSLHTD